MKAGKCPRIATDSVWQEFERDETMQAGVFSLINDSHSATAEFLDDAVMRDRLADHCDEMLGLELVQVNEGGEVGDLPKVSWREIPVTLIDQSGVSFP